MLSREIIKLLKLQCQLSYSTYIGTCRNIIIAKKPSLDRDVSKSCANPRQYMSASQQTSLLKKSCLVPCVRTSILHSLRHLHLSSEGKCEKNDTDKLSQNKGDSDSGLDDRACIIQSRDGFREKPNAETTNLHVESDDKAIEERRRNNKVIYSKRQKNNSSDTEAADAFIKNRFYNIQKTTDYARATDLQFARRRGDMAEEFKKDNKGDFEQLSMPGYPNNCSTSQLVVRSSDIRKDASDFSSRIVVTGESESIIKSIMNEAENTDELVTNTRETLYALDIVNEQNLPVKVEIPKLYHIAPLVNENTVLRNLVKIGVDLSKVTNCNELIKLNFKKDVKPLLLYLHDIGLPGDKVGPVLSKNPKMLTMDLDHLKARIRYLKSKQFSNEAVIEMITRHPVLLNFPTIELDILLGNLQKQLLLTGSELRGLVTYCPKLITTDPFCIQGKIHLLQDHCEFTKREMKQLVLNYGSVLIKVRSETLATSFQYLHDVMMIPHSLLIQFPEAMIKTEQHIKLRHKFLENLGRAQYNPELPNYVSLYNLLRTKDAEFSVEIAKASVAEYNNFLKTM